jgi:hypothetical protein
VRIHTHRWQGDIISLFLIFKKLNDERPREGEREREREATR